MKHQCTSCFREFFDDDPSSTAEQRVFCVFCGTAVPQRDRPSSAVPFSADFPREEAFALGVLGAAGSAFPDTLRQFRAHGAGAKPSTDSLMPVHTESEGAEGAPAPWRLGKFWTSLAIGFAVGAVAAAVLGQRSEPAASAVAASPRVEARAVAAPSAALTGCTAASAAPAAPTAPSAVAVVSKPPVTPVLEKRFWLERARAAQHQYRLADAEQFYRRVLARAPRDSEALSGLGEVELLRGATGAADAHFREALDANEDYVPAQVALADSLWQTGRAEDARRAYRHIVEHYSTDSYPPYVNQRLESAACAPQCQ